jgi:hypothetical protein
VDSGVDSGVDSEVERLIRLAFGPPGPYAIDGLSDANQGRGVFSRVVRVRLSWAEGPEVAARPASVVAKVPAAGPNGAAAVASGACRREALAYSRLLPTSPIGSPRAWLVDHGPGDRAGFVLEDLGPLRAVDQLDGLAPEDCLAVSHALHRFHRHWQDPARHTGLGVRHATPAAIAPDALARGLQALAGRWAADLDAARLRAFRGLVARRQALVEAFVRAGPPTLCHGDPRADNLVFSPQGAPVLFDWQQLAVQFGAADLAWLAATSLTPATRRQVERDLVDGYGAAFDQYRLGFVLPGLAVLLLAQRDTPDERTRRFVATSLDRIATALIDLEVVG